MPSARPRSCGSRFRPAAAAGQRASSCLALLVAACFIVIAAPSRAQPPSVNLRLPSDAAGGGTLAMRVTIPPAAVGARYPDGAPVLVFAPGGQGVGTISAGAEYAYEGFVVVTFVFPGGTNGGVQSDGIYDYRGPSCVAALRDVLLFAGGRKTDALGRFIGQILPIVPLTEMVGLLGSSNGGPISMAVLGTYGDQLPFVATYVGWENPTNDQTVLFEVGGRAYDCDPNSDGDGNGIAHDDGKNPYVTGYAPALIPLEFDRLAYDAGFSRTYVDPAGLHPPVARAGALFLDGNGNGFMDVVPGTEDCADLNANGRLDAGEDYLFRPLATYETGDFLLHFSVEVTAQASARALFGSSWPGDLADPAYAEEYWFWRDATRFYAALGATRPDLHALLVFAAADHVQASDEHLHIQQAYDGLRGQGIWCRLNPDRSYFHEVNPAPPGTPCDHDANHPVSWPFMALFDEPHPVSSTQGAVAAVLEMADRAHAGVWDVNLEGVLPGESSGAGAVGAPPAPLRIAPNPATESAVVTWGGGWGGPIALRLLSADGRTVGACRVDGSTEGELPLGRLGAARSPGRGRYFIEARGPSRRAAIAILLAE